MLILLHDLVHLSIDIARLFYLVLAHQLYYFGLWAINLNHLAYFVYEQQVALLFTLLSLLNGVGLQGSQLGLYLLHLLLFRLLHLLQLVGSVAVLHRL